MNAFFIKVRKKGQMEMDKNLMPRKVYVKICLSIFIWPFLRTYMKKAFNWLIMPKIKLIESYFKDGKTSCRQINIETMCPKLNCSINEQYSREGECCKFCAGND